jgi:drug/metabolite transporter (DMT)-like permease
MVWLVLLCSALFASGIFVNKILLFSLGPSLLSGIRMFVSGVVILIVNRKSYQQGSLKKIAENWKSFLAITLFSTLIPTICKAYAIKNMLSSKAAFMGSFDPFITACYAYFLLGEKLSVKKIIGIVLGFCGAFILFSVHSPIEDVLETAFYFSWPELAVLTSIAISRLGWILVQTQMRTHDFSSVDINGVVMTGAGFLALLLIPVWQFFGLFQESMAIPEHFWNFKTYGLLAYTVLVGNLIAYNLYGYLLKHNSATLLSLAGAQIPIYVTLLGYFFLGEPITVKLLCAGGAIFAGIFVFYYDDMTRSKTFLK